MKYVILFIVVILVAGVGAYTWYQHSSTPLSVEQADPEVPAVADDEDEIGEETEADVDETPTTERGPQSTIGTSADGHAISAYHFGTGETELLFVGGIHGGYSFNTSLVAFQLIDQLNTNPELVPDNITVTVIPVLNPDGAERATGRTTRFSASHVTSDQATRVASRFNTNDVDLNRNFDCEWQAQGTWQDRPVSGGDAPFSEPEAQAIRNYVATHRPAAAVVWYAAAGGVFASECRDGILPETRTLLEQFAQASGYTAHDSFDFYAITGDMVNWLARENIPAISVLLTDREDPEWSRNWNGIRAVINHYAR